MKKVAVFQITDTFTITGRGLVLAGQILEGFISVNDSIEFMALGNTLKRKVVAVEFIRFSQPREDNIGLVIECKDREEMKELDAWEPQGLKATVWTN